jgi:vacuolar-type H+-ATPase subunit I/STV1
MNTLDELNEQIEIMKKEFKIRLERRKILPKLIRNKQINIGQYSRLVNEHNNKLQRLANQITLDKLVLQKQQFEAEQAQLEQDAIQHSDQFINLVHQRDTEREKLVEEQKRKNDICNTVSWDLPGCNISGGKKRKTKRSNKNKRKSRRKCR